MGLAPQKEQKTQPVIRISPERIKLGESTYVLGSGFTPNRLVLSHLLRPDGTEYNPLRLRVNAQGEFSHRVDSTMLSTGTWEVWVDDEPSKTVSNHAKFVVET